MKRILLIDDETDLREEVLEWLDLEGYEAEAAADGLEGVKLAFKTIPDLVICDITMPNLDGHGVLLTLRSNPATAAVPFIFVTARASHGDIRKGMDLGADDYITKPFTRMELLQAVQSRLEKKAFHEQRLKESVGQWQQAFEREHEQRLLNAKLVAMFSHDFRTPLSIISNSVSMVRDYADQLTEERRQIHLNRAISSVRQLTQMLDDMLVTSKMEAGHLEVEPVPLEAAVFVQKIVEDFRLIHYERHTLEFESNMLDAVLLDPQLVRQIASNLISNAIKYSPKGGSIWVGVALEEQEFTLTVQDEGIGIPESDQATLFDAFQRASNTGDVAGMGLGLAIVKQAVDLHGGTIAFESELDVGTLFTVKIPVEG